MKTFKIEVSDQLAKEIEGLVQAAFKEVIDREKLDLATQPHIHDLKAEDAPKTVERLLKAYLAHRASSNETFLTFARRHDGETLRKLADAEVSS